MQYAHGLSGSAVWTAHAIIGLLLMYVGYLIVKHKTVNDNVGLVVFVLGVLAILYHFHLWYEERKVEVGK